MVNIKLIKNMTVIAHNARAYDAYFVYNYLINNSIVLQIIFRGSEIMYCKINNQLNIRLLDLPNFLSMALSQLPKSFGLQELKKRYFSHLYNTLENADHFSKALPCLPEIKYYDVDNMRPSLREDFIQWPFHFHIKLLAYSKSDVDILLNACWKFHSLVVDGTGPEHPNLIILP